MQSIFAEPGNLTLDQLFMAWRLSCIADGNAKNLQFHLEKVATEHLVNEELVIVHEQQVFPHFPLVVKVMLYD